ncbi:MAG: chemotaxis protein CheA, partial [Arenimonas sp.]
MLSLQDFLRQGAAPALQMDEAFADQPVLSEESAATDAAAAQAPAFVIDEHEPAFDEEARDFDTPEVLAVLEMPPEPATPTLDETLEFEPEPEPEFAMAEAAEQAPEISQAPEADDSADKRAAETALEAAEAEAALAGMIAAYPGEDVAEGELQAEAEPTVQAPEAAGGGMFSAEELAGAVDLMELDGVEAQAEPAEVAPLEVALSEDFYGLSEAELEALTAPGEPEAISMPVEADGFADLPSISEVPAWAGTAAEDAITAETAAPALEPEPEPIAEPVAEPEAAAEPEVVAVPEPEPEPEPEMAAEPEPEPQQVPEPEVSAEEEVFEDEPAPAPVVVAELAPIAAARPTVPMARDEADPEADLDTTDLDTELLDLFLEETNDILDHSDGMLARLRDRIDDRETIVNLQRDLHTLKGGARMAGIYAVGDLGHAMESLLESVAEGRQKLDATGVVVLERGFDRLHGMVARIGSRKAIALPAGLIAQVEALSEGKSLDEIESVQPEVAAPAAKESKPAPVAEPVAQRPLSAPVEDHGGDEEMSSVRAPQEQVRIRADLLDRLVNYAGEVAIYRARLEQQLGAFRANLGELDQTTTRLREQLRRLDIETEAQIVARYQREGETDDERFDPLELDRFTNQQQLTRALNESANDLVNLQGVLDELTRQYETLLLQQSRVSSDLQEGLMRTRMVPFDALVPRLRRVLRQAAIDTGKQVQLKVDGASGEMDRNVLDRMTAPLEHMLRNSMAHGLEAPDVRRKARKPEEGSVRIAVLREGSEVVLKVSDDGRGLDKEAIRRKAIEKGIIAADVELSDEAIYALILEGGFSTAETVTRLSGRGVGMDVVYSEIRQLGGTLQIKSDPGKGSEFTIRLPFTLAVTQAVFVKIGDTSFAVPIASVRGVGRISRADLEKQLSSENPAFTYAGEDYAIHDLGTLIGHAAAKAQDSLQMPLLLARSGDLRTAILIDQVLGSREIVVKPVGP